MPKVRFLLFLAILAMPLQMQSAIGQCDCPTCQSCGADESPESCEAAPGCSCGAASAPSSCCECLWCREKLFGDWHGVRSGLAQHGIVADLQFTQFYQGVTSGGAVQTDAYGGKIDYQFTFLGEQLGLWKGFTTLLHAETRYGQDINTAAGALALPNANMLWPLPGATETSIGGLLLMQALNERFVLAGGKFHGTDLFNMLYPNTGRGIDGFMNVSFLLPPTLFRTTGLSFNGGGVLVMEGAQIQSAFLVYDPQSTSTTVAPNLFGEGAVMLGYHRFFTDCCGLPGSHGFLANYSNRTYTSTDPLDWTLIPDRDSLPVRKRDRGPWRTFWTRCCGWIAATKNEIYDCSVCGVSPTGIRTLIAGPATCKSRAPV